MEYINDLINHDIGQSRNVIAIFEIKAIANNGFKKIGDMILIRVRMLHSGLES